ncbi:mitochondrial K+-H+ exchange-related-domain-containing protein [Roridomyces roridus]|uniref:Mitochondrial K+-H+ exchange-related-domain-containing protein n=1 Tax=Roridomyces roridus TaxID=1738132 RepID=A0AAD7FY66_9AGAR|nr:mitochondrial K+-H+ exchange-related-domain-containing protein [Roridomyces roridus]
MASVLPWGTMRVAVLPLTRAPRIVTYYHFAIVPPPTPLAAQDTSRWHPQNLVKRVSGKVNSTWVSWGEAKPDSWRFRIFDFGERYFDKIDFEEGLLKKIDVKTAPPAKMPDNLAGEEAAAWSRLTVPLVYPPSVSSGPGALSELRTLLQKRIPLHNRGFYTYAIIAPLTAPFMLIPVIPNLPFFFCAWRAWSHYQALRGARHLDELLQNGKIVPEPDAALDVVYAADAKDETKPAAVIVTRDSLGQGMRLLDVRPDEAKDMLRAYEQAVNRVG